MLVYLKIYCNIHICILDHSFKRDQYQKSQNMQLLCRKLLVKVKALADNWELATDNWLLSNNAVGVP